MSILLGRKFGNIHLKDARCVIHRTALQTRKRQDGSMAGLRTRKCLVFGSQGALVTDQIGPCAAQTGGTHSLMGIDHNVVFGGEFDAILVMVNHPLAIVMLAAGDDIAHIAALDRIVIILIHQLVGSLQMTLIVACTG